MQCSAYGAHNGWDTRHQQQYTRRGCTHSKGPSTLRRECDWHHRLSPTRAQNVRYRSKFDDKYRPQNNEDFTQHPKKQPRHRHMQGSDTRAWQTLCHCSDVGTGQLSRWATSCLEAVKLIRFRDFESSTLWYCTSMDFENRKKIHQSSTTLTSSSSSATAQGD